MFKDFSPVCKLMRSFITSAIILIINFIKGDNQEVNDEKLRQEWMELAPRWVKEVREGRNSPRKGILDPVMLEACGDVEGLSILDCGCGEGRFCRMLVERGAKYVLG